MAFHVAKSCVRSLCQHRSPGAAYAIAFAAMASCSSASAEGCLQDWSRDVTHPAFHRRLTTVPGDAASSGLPVDAVTHELADILAHKTHVGVSAPPGSGKTELVAMWTLAF